MLSDIITAYQTKATELGYTFVSGSLEDVVNVPSNDMGKFLWLDRPVTGQLDSKVLRTKSGLVSYQLNLHSLQPYTQEQESTELKQTIYDFHLTRLIDFLGDVHTDSISIAKGLRDNSSTVFEHKIHMGKYIGVMVTLNYQLYYCV